MLSPQAIRWGSSANAPSQQRTAGFSVPAPSNGLNIFDPLMAMQPADAITLTNMIPAEYGCKVRKGWAEFANDSAVSGLKEIRSIMPFLDDAGTSKLFIATSDGVYDVTSGGTTATLVVDYSGVAGFVTTGNAGYCSYVQFNNVATGSFLLVADEVNGYFYYTGGTATWTTAPTLSGGVTDPKTIYHVNVVKNRVWLSAQDSGTAYYLDLPGAVSGANTAFEFGNKFNHGGHIKGIYNFTRDGGEGMDDFSVVVSDGGDILVYQGYDPATSSLFVLVGEWYLGDMPAGTRIASNFGGDLFILSSYGLVSMGRLIGGGDITDKNIYVTKKIERAIRDIMVTHRSSRGWEVQSIPLEGVILINTPKRTNYDYTQFVMSMNTGGWAVWNSVPILSSAVFQDVYYFGNIGTGTDASVYQLTGYLENLALDDSYEGATPFSGQLAFNAMETPGRWKRIQLIIPRFISNKEPLYSVEARYDFDISGVTSPNPPASPNPGFTWEPDTGLSLWDTATWGGTVSGSLVDFDPYEGIKGTAGMGRWVSLTFKGESADETTLLGFDVMADVGGLL